MSIDTIEQLRTTKCQPCEGGVPPVERDEAERLFKDLPGWRLTDDAKRIRREWTVANFMAGMDFLNRVAELSEQESDLHLAGYRNVAIELWTHAIGGLSENDFILAAKINELPIAVKS